MFFRVQKTSPVYIVQEHDIGQRRAEEVYLPIHPNDFDRRHRLQSEGHIIIFSMGGRGVILLFAMLI